MCVASQHPQALGGKHVSNPELKRLNPILITIYSPGQLFTPAAAAQPGAANTTASPNGVTNLPAVVFTHGGSMRQMYAAFHYDLDYALLYAQNQYLASLGFVVLSINYRGGPGYGVKFRAANRSGWQGASEYQDVLAGAQWLQQQANVVASKIGIYGLSYGGLNAMQALTRNSDVFSAGVANAPVFNWLTQKRFEGDSAALELARQRNAGFRTLPVGPRSDIAGPGWFSLSQENQMLAWSSSPAGHLDKLTSPLLVIQGDSDANVDFQETVGIVAGNQSVPSLSLSFSCVCVCFSSLYVGCCRSANDNGRVILLSIGVRVGLRARGFNQLETLVIPNERHGFVRFENQVMAANRTIEFLHQQLMEVHY